MEKSREIYRFRKNSREEIVISIYKVNNAEYLSISRFWSCPVMSVKYKKGRTSQEQLR